MNNSGHSCLVHGLRWNTFSFSVLRIMFAVGLFIYGIYYVNIRSFYAYSLGSFYHKWLLNFVENFLCVYWDNSMVLSFNLLIWCFIFIDLHLLKNPCIPGINSTWSLCMILLMCCWILFARILLRIFASVFITDVLSCSVMSDSLLPHRL